MLLGLFASLPLAAGTAAAANADAFRHRDATGDVLVVQYAEHLGVDSSQRRPDIEQFTVLHGRWALGIATSMRDFGGIDDNWTATVLTSKGDKFLVGRATDTGNPGTFFFVRRNGYRFECDGIRVSRTPSGMIAKLPTRCLGNPWKVQVGVQASTTYNEYDDISGQDDALRVGSVRYGKPRLSPWIAR